MSDEDDNGKGYCCTMMGRQLRQVCDIHASPWDCPDRVVVQLADGTYGLPMRDGDAGAASSTIAVWHCPWCGSPLPGHRPHPLPDAEELGKALTEAEIEARMDAWHAGKGGMSAIHEYLGWTEGEYAAWAVTGDLPFEGTQIPPT